MAPPLSILAGRPSLSTTAGSPPCRPTLLPGAFARASTKPLGMIVHKKKSEDLRYTLGYDYAYGVSSDGRSGGLCVFWNNSLDLRVLKYSCYHIDMIIDESGEPWRLTCWYGEATRSERYKTWEMMTHIRADNDLPWLCIGDFNEVLRREEHMSICDRDESQMRGV